MMAFRDLAQSNNYDLSFITKGSALLDLPEKTNCTKPEKIILDLCNLDNQAYQNFFFIDRQEINNTILYSVATDNKRLHIVRYVTGEFHIYVKLLCDTNQNVYDIVHPTYLFTFSSFNDLRNAKMLQQCF